MENNPVNNQNSNVISEKSTRTVNKKAMLFISLSIIIPGLINQIGNVILTESIFRFELQNSFNVASAFLTTAINILRLILVLVFCSKLTDNRPDAIHFLGIYSMGGILGSILTSALVFIHSIIFDPMTAPTNVSSLTRTAISVIGTAASIIFTCILYYRLIAKKTLHPVLFADSTKIKKNMIFAMLFILLASAVETGVIAIIPVLESTGIITQGISTSKSIIILSDFISLLLTVSTFIILYLFGFRHSKNRNDALNFAACYYFPLVFYYAISSLSNTVLLILSAYPNSIEPVTAIVTVGLISVISFSLFVVQILFIFRALRQIFPVQQITPEPFPAEETYTDDYYTDPSHIENAEIQSIDIKK